MESQVAFGAHHFEATRAASLSDGTSSVRRTPQVSELGRTEQPFHRHVERTCERQCDTFVCLVRTLATFDAIDRRYRNLRQVLLTEPILLTQPVQLMQ